MRNGIGFYKPKHLEGDYRYLFDQPVHRISKPSPEFASFTVEERASRMFSATSARCSSGWRGRRRSSPTRILDGFTVILDAGSRRRRRPAAARCTNDCRVPRAYHRLDYIGGRLPAAGSPPRGRAVLAWDGETALGPTRVSSWDDDFVSTYKVSNYQLAPGVSCP